MTTCKLLLSDGSPPVLNLFEQVTGGLGIDLKVAKSLSHVVETCQGSEPEILFLHSPEPSEKLVQVCRSIRNYADSHVILALDDQRIREAAFDAGADCVVHTPLHATELRQAIEVAVKVVGFERLVHQQSSLELAYQKLSQSNAVIMEGWSRALDLRDNETEGHSVRVTELTVRLAERFGYQEPELTDIRYGALLHDVGKIGIPDSILHKDGFLTHEERREMQRHPEYAYGMLQGLKHLPNTVAIPYCHHEKWDGTGYPLGTSGEDIPFPARIFSVVDVYDALKSERPYKPAWTDEQVFQELRDQSGKHFDPNVVEEFISMILERADLAA